MTFQEFLTNLTNPTFIPLVWGVLESVLLHLWPSYNEILDPRWKRVVVAVASFGIPLLGVGAQWLFFNVVPNMDIVWAALVAGFAAFTTSQGAHTLLYQNKGA